MAESSAQSACAEASSNGLAQQLREANFRLNCKVLQLETLYEAGLALGGSLQLEKIAGEFLLLAMSMVDARAGFLLLKDESTGRLELVHHAGLTPAARQALCGGDLRPRLRRALGASPLRLAHPDLPPALGAHQLLVLPLARDGLVGVMDKEVRGGIVPFTESDTHLLELACRQAGSALANARLYRRVEAERSLNQGIVSSTASGVLSTDLRGRIISANPVVTRLFGGQPLAGRSCAGLFSRHGCRRLAAAVRAALADGQGRQVEAERMGRGELSLSARIAPLRQEDGPVRGLVVAVEDLTEQTRLRALFRQYVSDPLLDRLLASGSPPVLGGEHRAVTVLFVDLVGSTQLLDQVGAPEMVRLLNDCFTRLVDVVFRYNGMLDKYTGDGFMAVYGAPVAFPDDVLRAAHSALSIRTEMARFNRGAGVSWGLKMGLSQGPVTAGNVGSPRRMEYTVIGPDVCLAARLSDRACAGEILVSERVHQALEPQFELAPCGPQAFKGLRERIPVWELVGPRGRRRARACTRAAGPQPAADESARVDLNIPMIPDMELTATQTAEAVAQYMGLDADKTGEVKMALVEACINAIEHSQSKDGRLQIDFEVTAEALWVTISDRGHGFDLEAVRQEVERRRQSGGRRRGWGLQLMQELMDEVEVRSDQGGTTIRMVKRR
ncbi:MAG: adenylate/guanylate cyclase domain-containing protein [Candidatus Latescibacterota bacterium]